MVKKHSSQKVLHCKSLPVAVEKMHKSLPNLSQSKEKALILHVSTDEITHHLKKKTYSNYCNLHLMISCQQTNKP